LVNINSDITYSDNGLTVSIIGFETHYDKFVAIISISVDLTKIIPNGGRFSIYTEHNNGIGKVYIKNRF
jgi:hypothetical protein